MKRGQAGQRSAGVAAALVLASVTVLSGCGGGSGNGSGVKNGGILKVGMTQTIDNLNPFVGFEQVSTGEAPPWLRYVRAVKPAAPGND